MSFWKKNRSKFFFSSRIQVLFFSSFSALPYGDDNNDIYSNDDYEESSSENNNRNSESNDIGGHDSIISTIPKFVSAGKNDLVNEGGTISLPCLVDRLGKRETDILLLFEEKKLGNARGNGFFPFFFQ